MKYFDRSRKRLTKKHFVRGTLTSSTGTDEVAIESSAGLPLTTIGIIGSTHQDEYEGYNLFNQEELLTDSKFTKAEYNGFECLKANGSTAIPFEAPAGNYSFQLEFAYPNGYDMYVNIHYENGTSTGIVSSATDAQHPDFKLISKSITTTSKIIKISFSSYNYINKPMYLKNIMLNTGDSKPYEPYVGGIASPNPGKKIHYAETVDCANLTAQKGLLSLGIKKLRSKEYISFPELVSTLQISGVYSDLVPQDVCIGVYSEVEGWCTIYQHGQVETTATITGAKYRIFISSSELTEDNADIYWSYLSNCTIVAEYEKFGKPYSQPIKNVNSEGMSVVLHGTNLFNKGTVTLGKNLSARHGGLYGSEIRGVSDYIKVDSSKQYSIYRPYQAPAGYSRYMCCYDANKTFLGEPTRLSGIQIGGYCTYGLVANTKYVRLNFWYDAENSINESEGLIFYEGAEEKLYEPYFCEEITIPASVEVNGETVLLRFAGTAEMSDVLIVDRRNSKVKYIQTFDQYEMTGVEHQLSSGENNGAASAVFFAEGVAPNDRYIHLFKSNQLSPMYLNRGKLYEFDLWSMQPSDDVGMGMGIHLSFANTTKRELVDLIKQKYSDGDPIVFQYVLNEPKEHDITNTDLGQALLNLAVPRMQNGILRVESAVPASRLNVDYYSTEKEEKVTLEVVCVNEAAEELKRTSRNVRRGSKYQVKSPEIDGYIPINGEIYGVAKEDTEIYIEYKEAEDVTV